MSTTPAGRALAPHASGQEATDQRPTGQREVRYEHSRNLPAVLEALRITVLVSTYQAGKVVVLGTHQGTLGTSFHNFDHPMGLAVRPDRLAVAGQNQVWLLDNHPDVARQLEPTGKYDASYLTRSWQITGPIQAHELGWVGEELWVVNTLFSCLCTPDPHYSFVPRWCPPFISALAPEDRCHLNGLAVHEGRARYVTAIAPTDSPAGWRPHKLGGGCLIDIDSGQVLTDGFAMPHSPRVYRGQVWLLDSGRGRLVQVDPRNGTARTVAELPGYVRGLTFHGNMAVIGLSAHPGNIGFRRRADRRAGATNSSAVWR